VDFGFIKRLRRESAISAGHHVFSAYEIGETDQPFGNPFRMFNDVAGVGDNPGTKYLAVRQLYTLEQVVFMFVARIRGLEAERTSMNLEDILYDLGQVCFVDPRSLIDAVAGVKPDAFRRNPIERCIGRFDINFCTPSLLVFIKVWLNKDVWQERIVDLKQDARSDNCAIVLVELGSEGVEVLFLSFVVLIDADPRWGRRG